MRFLNIENSSLRKHEIPNLKKKKFLRKPMKFSLERCFTRNRPVVLFPLERCFLNSWDFISLKILCSKTTECACVFQNHIS